MANMNEDQRQGRLKYVHGGLVGPVSIGFGRREWLTPMPQTPDAAAEKLQLLEQVSQSLCCQPDAFASPDWHADVLLERRQRLLDGSSARIPWK